MVPHTLRFYAFDILHLNGEDLRDQPLLDRRSKLKGLLGRDRTSPIQFSDEFTGDSAAFFRACAKHGLEGVAPSSVIALSERTQQDMAQEQVLHRKRFGDYRHRPRPQDWRDKSLARKCRSHICGGGFHRSYVSMRGMTFMSG